MPMITLETKLETAAQLLPKGYSIAIRVEKDSAWMELTDQDGVPVKGFEGVSAELGWSELMLWAITFALSDRDGKVKCPLCDQEWYEGAAKECTKGSRCPFRNWKND